MWVQVVEDDPIMRQFLSAVIQRMGYQVALYEDAETALHEHSRHPFSIVIVDWLLPGMDGLELCQHLREIPRGDDLVILIVTSRDRPEDLEPVIQAGADDYLPKPISGPLLRTRLRLAEKSAVERTRRRTAENALRAKDLEVQYLARMESLGRLAGGISHDFNNLLTAIQGYSGMLLEDLQAGSPAHDDVLEIDNAAHRAAELTRQLLAFSRGRVGEPTTIDFGKVLTDSVRFLRRLLGTDIIISVDTTVGAHWVRADPGQVDQIVMNLAINARDAMPNGGSLQMAVDQIAVEAGQTLSSRIAPAHYTRLVVRDTGSGMDAYTKSRIFEPFFSTKTANGGTGLGLSIIYGIVTKNGGYIDVESSEGVGTTFTVYLPAAQDPSDDLAKSNAPEVRVSETGTNILLVEDDVAVRRLAYRLLENNGFEVTIASTGVEAVQLFESQQFDVVLTDIVMPDMNGVDLAEHLLAADPDIRIVIMSGYPTNGVSSVLRAGQVEYLQKPFTPNHLLQRLAGVLQ